MNYYISDTHFGHDNILRFDNRPFVNTDDMEREIVRRWNSRVKATDTVYIIGDFCWRLEKEWIRILDLLNGQKVLIQGNHDIKNPSAALVKRFLYIRDTHTIKDGEYKIYMQHNPCLFYTHSGDQKMWHFCGHTHNRTAEELKRQEFVQNLVDSCKESYDNRGQIINVGCMLPYMNYTPRTAEELIEWWHNYYKK